MQRALVEEIQLKFKTYEELKAAGDTKWCRDHLRRKVELDQFPKPVVLSRDPTGRPRRIAWIVEEIESWKAAQVAQRDAELARRPPPSPPKPPGRIGRPPGSKNRPKNSEPSAPSPAPIAAAPHE